MFGVWARAGRRARAGPVRRGPVAARSAVVVRRRPAAGRPARRVHRGGPPPAVGPGARRRSATCCWCSARWPGWSCAAQPVVVGRRRRRCGRDVPRARLPERAGRGLGRPVPRRRRRPRAPGGGLDRRRAGLRRCCWRRRAQRPPALGPERAVGYAAWLVVVLLRRRGAALPGRAVRRGPPGPRGRDARRRPAPSGWRWPATCTTPIGHSLSMIAVQAGVALHLLDEHPEQARPALTAIRDGEQGGARGGARRRWPCCARTATVPRAPTPGWPGSRSSSTAARLGGLEVQLPPEPLPDNGFDAPGRRGRRGVPRGAGGADQRRPGMRQATRATVTVRRAAERLEVAVVDDGVGTARAASEGGGLRGMRERAACPGRPRRRPAPTRPAASGSPYGFHWTTRCGGPRGRDHGGGGRRPGAGAGRVPGPAGRRAGHAGGRRGRRRRERAGAGPRDASRRRADGHPDARGRRAGGDPADRGRPRAGEHPGAGADDVRAGRVRVRGAARRCERLPGQGHRAGRPGQGGARRRGRATPCCRRR